MGGETPLLSEDYMRYKALCKGMYITEIIIIPKNNFDSFVPRPLLFIIYLKYLNIVS